MDILTYSYQTNSNKLLKVADAALVDKYGFTDDAVNTATDTADDYTYDANGNMLTDTNKGISGIEYNHLNLPTLVYLPTGNITYTYDATGVKLSKKVTQNYEGVTLSNTHYHGNYIYEESQSAPPLIMTTQTLKFFNQPEGYVEPNGSGGFDYVYQYKDQVNNVRLSYSDLDGNGSINPSTEILHERNYYPFGLKHKGYNNVVSPNANSVAQKFKFGGKELNEELGLNWYDISARNYDPALGRWMNIDPLAETSRRFSPYTYVLNNPIYFIDPDGMQGTKWKNQKNQLVYDTEANGGKGAYTKHATTLDKKVGDALRNSGKTGEEKFNTLVNSEHDTTVEFHEGSEAFTMGHTESNLDDKGEKITDSKIDVYMGSIDEAIADPTILDEPDASIISENNLKAVDLAAAVLGHEVDHDTPTNTKIRNKEEDTGIVKEKFNSETIPRKTQTTILEDIAKKKKD